MNEQDQTALRDLVRSLETAWNAGDGEAFAASFAEDADMVIITGARIKGRAEIRAGHEMIFSTIYAGSRIAYAIEQMRALGGDVALAHLHGTLEVPGGPLAGTMNARLTLTASRAPSGWRIAALQTTQVRDMPGRPPRETAGLEGK